MGAVADFYCFFNIYLGFSYFFSQRPDYKVHAPKFPKVKDEGWILVLGEIDSADVIALKRVGLIRRHQKVSLAFYTPEEVGRKIYTLYVMSDAYLGLDQQYEIYLEVVEADLSAQINTDDIIDFEES